MSNYDKQEKQERIQAARNGRDSTSTAKERNQVRIERAAKEGRG